MFFVDMLLQNISVFYFLIAVFTFINASSFKNMKSFVMILQIFNFLLSLANFTFKYDQMV